MNSKNKNNYLKKIYNQYISRCPRHARLVIFHIRALRHIRTSLNTEASKTIAAAIVGSRLDFCNSLLAGTSVSNLTRLQRVQNTLARVVAQKPGSATSRLSFQIYIGFRFATELVSKLLRLLSACSNLSSHPIFHLSSQDMCRRDHSALLRVSQFAFLHVKPPWQLPNSFSSAASNIWNALPNHLSSIPTLPAFRRALKHHLFLLAYPNSSAKSGKIKPAQCITLRDTAPTTATAPPGNTMPPM